VSWIVSDLGRIPEKSGEFVAVFFPFFNHNESRTDISPKIPTAVPLAS